MDRDRSPVLYGLGRIFFPPDAETRRIVHWTMGISLIFWANVATIAWTPAPLLIWNISASAPIGGYAVIGKRGIARGDMVAARVPAPWRAIAAARRYIPVNVPLIKRVAAVHGDRVCAAGRTLLINGRLAMLRRERDGQGHALPRWHGCQTLARGDYLLLTDDPASFDGRYFGVTREADLVGKVRPLWTR